MSMTIAGLAGSALDESDNPVGLLWASVPSAAAPCRYVAPPDGIVDMVAGQRNGVMSLHVVGASAAVSNKSTLGLDFAIVARLRAGVAPVLFRIPAREVAESAVPLDALWPAASGLLQRLLDEPSLERQAACLAGALETRYRQVLRRTDSVSLVNRALRGIKATSFEADPTVSAVAARLGMSERTLRRAFDDAVGLPPRTLVALNRLRRALTLVTATRSDGATIAARAGYCDQSHLIRDFRRYMQTTPERLRAAWTRSPPIVRPFLAIDL